MTRNLLLLLPFLFSTACFEEEVAKPADETEDSAAGDEDGERERDEISILCA